MDQRFTPSSDASEISCESQNRRLGSWFLLSGVACTLGTWYFGPRVDMLSGGRIIALMLAGAVLLLGGLATVISPPKVEYKSPSNKRRIEVLGFIGIVLGGVELYFYNEINGLW
jgi:hypothetical protein